MNRTTLFKGLKMLFAKCQYTSTLVRVTQQKAKEMYPRMGLASY